MKRVGIAGFIHESNTFLCETTTHDNFDHGSLTRGSQLLERWDGSKHELGGFLGGARRWGFDPIPIMATYAIPSGIIQADAFEVLADEMISELRKSLPLDGLLLALHGAAVAENFPNADGELLRRFRQVVGSTLPIMLTLDLHANVSSSIICETNATVIYRSNPHLDQYERGLEVANLMARTLDGHIQPVQALETPPLLINISKQYTQQSPAFELYEDAREVMTWPGILSASVAMGFCFADVETMGASFLVVADKDRKLARAGAQWMAQRAWQRRSEFVGQLVSPADAVRQAIESPVAPIVLMDVGDNVGGGSAGDSAVLLAEVMKQKGTNALVVLYDPASVRDCIATGVKGSVVLSVGGKTDQRHGQPIQITGRVRLISDGIFIENQVRHGGWSLNDQGVTVVLETEHQHTVILTSHRMPPLSLEQLLSLGVKPEQKRILIVKGVVAPRAAYEPIAAGIILVDSPGATSADLLGFEYRHRRRPLYPLELEAVYCA